MCPRRPRTSQIGISTEGNAISRGRSCAPPSRPRHCVELSWPNLVVASAVLSSGLKRFWFLAVLLRMEPPVRANVNESLRRVRRNRLARPGSRTSRRRTRSRRSSPLRCPRLPIRRPRRSPGGWTIPAERRFWSWCSGTRSWRKRLRERLDLLLGRHALEEAEDQPPMLLVLRRV